jgi:DNA-directed RNA polymerase specialized sigma24 family protein
VRELARSLVRHDVHLADDLAQEACLAALRKTPETGSPLRPVARDRRAQPRAPEAPWRRTSQRARGGRSAARGAAVALDHVEQLSVHRELVDAVSALDEPYRETIVLRYFEDLTPSQIARRTSVPVATGEGAARARPRQAAHAPRSEHGGDARAHALGVDSTLETGRRPDRRDDRSTPREHEPQDRDRARGRRVRPRRRVALELGAARVARIRPR